MKIRTVIGMILLPLIIFGKSDSVNKYVVGYIFCKDRVLKADNIAAEMLTHINYAFADIKRGVIIEGFKNDEKNFKILNSLKKRNPSLKILISVGGWTWSGNFSDMALTRESRKKFIDSSIKFIIRHNLDGIDLDWEYPGLTGYGNTHRTEDKENFTALLKELRQALNEETKKSQKYYLSTIAAGAHNDYLAHTEMGKDHQYLDFINVMTYDFREAEADEIAGHHTCLYTHPADDKKLSTASSIKEFLQAGVPKGKIVVGVAFYGRSWQGVRPENNGLYQPGGKQVHLNTSFRNLKPHLENKQGFIRYWDDQSKAPYLWNKKKRIFVSYDDEESIAAKSDYIMKNGLKGAMFWAYHSDFQNRLLKTLWQHLIKKAKN